MNWCYLQEWAMSLIFFAPALVILALTLMALPLAKGAQFTANAERAAAKSRPLSLHVKSHASPPGEEVAEETA